MARRQRLRTIELNAEDVLLASEATDNPWLLWCYTDKLKHSVCLKDPKHDKTLIAVNLKTLHSDRWSLCSPDEMVQAASTYLSYTLIHELTHYAIDSTSIPEEIWDRTIAQIVREDFICQLQEEMR
jgi:hypothetical protein